MAYPDHYVNGDVKGEQLYQVRLSDGRVFEPTTTSESRESLRRIVESEDVCWAECESISGFYSCIRVMNEALV